MEAQCFLLNKPFNLYETIGECLDRFNETALSLAGLLSGIPVRLTNCLTELGCLMRRMVELKILNGRDRNTLRSIMG